MSINKSLVTFFALTQHGHRLTVNYVDEDGDELSVLLYVGGYI